MNILLSSLAALLLAAPAGAQTESLAAAARAFDAQAAAAIAAQAPADVFAGVPECAVLDEPTFRAWTLDEAARLAAPCLKAVSARRGVALKAVPGFLTAPEGANPPPTGLVLESDAAPGSALHRDLAASLSRRGERLLDQPVRLLTRGEVVPESVSAVQGALARCVMIDMVRDVRSGADFVGQYGSCIRRDADLQVSALRAGPGLSVILETARPEAQVAALDGYVTVNGGAGPVRVLVIARPASVLY
ncbi:MAG: hypothetical protein KGM24_00800 [Elusimicrobia bacterium]|nr:hypothetical protein [Elusimicrobiota bacterium]